MNPDRSEQTPPPAKRARLVLPAHLPPRPSGPMPQIEYIFGPPSPPPPPVDIPTNADLPAKPPLPSNDPDVRRPRAVQEIDESDFILEEGDEWVHIDRWYQRPLAGFVWRERFTNEGYRTMEPVGISLTGVRITGLLLEAFASMDHLKLSVVRWFCDCGDILGVFLAGPAKGGIYTLSMEFVSAEGARRARYKDEQFSWKGDVYKLVVTAREYRLENGWRITKRSLLPMLEDRMMEDADRLDNIRCVTEYYQDAQVIETMVNEFLPSAPDPQYLPFELLITTWQPKNLITWFPIEGSVGIRESRVEAAQLVRSMEESVVGKAEDFGVSQRNILKARASRLPELPVVCETDGRRWRGRQFPYFSWEQDGTNFQSSSAWSQVVERFGGWVDREERLDLTYTNINSRLGFEIQKATLELLREEGKRRWANPKLMPNVFGIRRLLSMQTPEAVRNMGILEGLSTRRAGDHPIVRAGKERAMMMAAWRRTHRGQSIMPMFRVDHDYDPEEQEEKVDKWIAVGLNKPLGYVSPKVTASISEMRD